MNGLEGKNKQGFVNGKLEPPSDEANAELVAWKANNSTICSWLFNAVDITIQPSVASHKIARDFWLDLKERYSIANGPRTNQLKSEYHNLRQKGQNVVLYYNKFKALWDALYGSIDVTCGCICAAAPKLRERVEIEKTHDFVLGLDDEQFGSLRTQMLSMDPFPTINKAYSLASQEERHHSIVRSRDDKTEIMSFAAQARSLSRDDYAPPQRPTCTFCGRLGHHYEVCYQRVGSPTVAPAGEGEADRLVAEGEHLQGEGNLLQSLPTRQQLHVVKPAPQTITTAIVPH